MPKRSDMEKVLDNVCGSHLTIDMVLIRLEQYKIQKITNYTSFVLKIVNIMVYLQMCMNSSIY